MREARVVIVSDYVGGEGAASGGAGHAALDSYRALRAAGVDARIVAGFGGAPAGEDGRFTALGGADLRQGGSGDMLRAIYNPAAKRALAEALADADPNATLVILHQWTRYLSPAALGLLDRFPTMIYMHDYFWACPNGAYYDFVEGRPCTRQPLGVRCCAANCDRAGRLHKAGRLARGAARKLAVRGGPERRLFLHMAPAALATAAPLLPGERHALLHNPLALPAQPPAPPAATFDFGYFGRLEPEKGVGDLIAAAAKLGLSGLFVGQGQLEPEIARHPNLEHRAWVPRAAIGAAMASCAIVVLPSLWHETWGLIVPEAMAAGVKVLVSRRAGSASLVEGFGGGVTFDPGVPGDLAGGLHAALAMSAAPVADWRALRDHLSAATHAERIVALAGEAFGLSLLPASASAPRSTPPASAPPPPM